MESLKIGDRVRKRHTLCTGKIIECLRVEYNVLYAVQMEGSDDVMEGGIQDWDKIFESTTTAELFLTLLPTEEIGHVFVLNGDLRDWFLHFIRKHVSVEEGINLARQESDWGDYHVWTFLDGSSVHAECVSLRSGVNIASFYIK